MNIGVGTKISFRRDDGSADIGIVEEVFLTENRFDIVVPMLRVDGIESGHFTMYADNDSLIARSVSVVAD